MSVRKGDLLKPRLRVLTCGTLACTKVASMDPKWHHMGLGKGLRRCEWRAFRKYLPEPRLSVGKYLPVSSICPTGGCLRGRSSERKNKVVARDGLRDQSLIQLLQLLFTAASSVYTVFTVWFCQIDCCGRFGTLFSLPRWKRQTARPHANANQRGIMWFLLLTLFG